MKRKIIQITRNRYYITALCDDGTIWEIRIIEDSKWRRLPDIPQD